MEQKAAGDPSGDAQKQPEYTLTSPVNHALATTGPDKICPDCGAVNPADAVFCYKCGIKLPENTAPDKKVCTGCGVQNAVIAEFCYKCGLKLPENVRSYQPLRYGGFWVRVGAYFIDGIIISIITTIIYIPWLVWMINKVESAAYKYSADTTAIDDTITTWFVVTTVVVFVAVVLYNTFSVGKWGKTFGKMAMGLKVIKSDGSKVNYARALGRYAVYLLNGITFYLSFLVIAFTPKKRGLHDYMADTIVIKTK